MHTIDEINALIAEVKPGFAPAPEDELVKTGALDSVAIMSLVMALTQTFDVEITPLDLKEENFHTPAAILALVNRLEEE